MGGQAVAGAELITRVLALVDERVPAAQATQAAEFVRQFLSQADPDDLRGRDPMDLYGAALSLWQFARKRTLDTPVVRIYNPRVDEHGWQSPHTVAVIVHRDMPFLVDSVRMEVNARGFITHLMVHPVMRIRREPDGTALEVTPTGAAFDNGEPESFMYLEVSRETDPAALKRLEAGLVRVLADVRAAVSDWQPMLERMREVVAGVRAAPPPLPEADTSESVALLDWLTRDHFTFLGCRDYDLVQQGDETVLRAVRGSGLGILRRDRGDATSASFAVLPSDVRAGAHKAELLVLTKSNTRSTVHRPSYMDYVGVKRFDAEGRVVGERRFLGLYTSVAYSASPLEIPVLRRKVQGVIARSGVLPGSHMGKTLRTIIETYPRDELFQADQNELLRTTIGIMHLQERQRTKLFVRRDPFGRFLACLIYVPRDNYNTEVRERMQDVLMRAFDGVSYEHSVSLSESVLARVLIVVHIKPGARPEFNERDLESRLIQAARRWQDDLSDALTAHLGEERGLDLFKKYEAAFPAAYRAECTARTAVHDVEVLEGLSDDELAPILYAPLEAMPGELRFRLFRRGTAVTLSQSLPMLEHMGVRVIGERSYEIEPRGERPAWIHDIGLAADAGVDVDAVQESFEETFQRAWRGEVESDELNKLVLLAGLDWREVMLLRALSKYVRQAGFTFSQAYMQAALAAHPDIARRLVDLFLERHDPRRGDTSTRGATLIPAIEQALDDVASLDEDRILRRFLALILATTRTNYFQTGADGAPKPYLSLKLDPSKVPALPDPRPMYEIYVYSPRVEGVHLRGGGVARGGLRWSDRMEDFRTEVLGLMKAQMVKNAVIVPVGAKGGFVVKMPPPGGDREALRREVVDCYSTFLRGLLDLTGNRSGGRVVPPPDVVRHDEDDTYLVVAADKGTATFSDIANGVAREYGLWLGDAFASGGSSGYDHKKMGITARGAWESVKAHFRALGKDVQTSDVTVVGIGDMSGDVFGNGMLLSRRIKLVAAFDHRHIFLDPDPDQETSFEERSRLFRQPRSSWAEYASSLVSPGGGVFPRSAKSVVLSPQVRRVLAVEAEAMTPSDLVRAILRAPVDLLYNGGIGTYVKASDESHGQVGDRANDGVRVDAAELRCRAVGEGGNLGFTQRGRVEYALAGGRIHTDAIDNSAGVACSDHEVNIKILLNAVVADGELTEKQRDRLLREMTDDVAELVLRNNYYQAQSLAASGAMELGLFDGQVRFMRHLERVGRLNRDLEFLPSDETLTARKAARQGLTAPELAVLLAYSKLWLFDELVASDVPEDPYIATALQRYFPKALRDRYRASMPQHPLKREIIATHVCNSMVNRVGSVFVFSLMEETGATAPEVVRAYLLAREAFRLVDLWNEIDALDNIVPDAAQTAMIVRIAKVMVRITRWFLRHRYAAADLDAEIGRFRTAGEQVTGSLDTLLGEQDRARLDTDAQACVASGVPASIATRVARTRFAPAVLDVTELARSGERDIACVAAVHFILSARLEFAWLREQIGKLPIDTHWQVLARAALRDDAAERLRSLTASVLVRSPDLDEPGALVAAWADANARPLTRLHQLFTEAKAAGSAELSVLSVALRELHGLV